MKVENGDIDVVQEFGVILDGIATREEYHDLLLEVFLQKREKE